MNGFIVVYINFQNLEQEQEINRILQMVRNQNKSLLDKMLEQGYEAMFVATSGEASRVEKIDFEKPSLTKGTSNE